MIKKSNLIKFSSAILTSLFIASCDSGSDSNNSTPIPLDVSIEASGSIGFSQAAFILHNGSFDFFDTGNVASDELIQLAEDGNDVPLIVLATSSTNRARTGVITAPRETSETSIITASQENRYLSYYSQAVPSSDTFIGNDNPIEFDLYQMILDSPDGTVTIEVTDLYDAGTEVNDFLTSNGNEFIAGLPEGDPEAGEDENGVITLHTPTFYDEYLNPGDFDVSTLNPGGTVVARITFTRREETGTQ